MRHVTWRSIISGLVSWLALAAPASAEWFTDLYLGGAFTQHSDVTVKSAAGDTTFKNIAFNRSAAFGGRIGYWFESPKVIGLAVDVSHFRPDTVPSSLKRLDLYMTSMAVELMLRWPLVVTEAFPRGRLQPFMAGGPAVALAEAKDTANLTPPDQYKIDFPPGFQAGAGVAWQLGTHAGLFAEYRFTHFRPEFAFRDRSGAATLKTDLNTRYPVGGFSLRF